MSHAPHDHAHHHLPTNLTKAFLIGIGLNLIFVIIEAGAGLWLESLALLSDAGHNLSDVISLVLALVAIKVSQKKPNDRFTFGYSKSTTLVSLFNAILLMVAVGAIGWEAINRFGQVQPLNGKWITLVSLVGILINTLTALLFLKDKDHDLNVKGAYLHMAADALVSLGVVISGLVIMYTNWYWIDSVVSLLIILVIIAGTWGLLKESLRLSLDGVPRGVDLGAIREYLINIEGVQEVHDLHVWALSTTDNSLTVHLVLTEDQQENLLPRIHDDLFHKFNIAHATIQLEEPGNKEQCLHTH
ncbi:cobalt transporter [Adhaeribacter aerolatus]|uniref:Cobalt transporter n=1 Tax=Adhaeribacter aerolatus TaxID=670289 RepID=A0A512ASD5_9BACT|nr:cation diffusion facilitator family transporter [Adhaeribacter aerolatus]GEO02619.1 cobalt transporter [Adhaeribacter aerolatus]